MLNTKVLHIFTIFGYQNASCFLMLHHLLKNSTEKDRSITPAKLFICLFRSLLFRFVFAMLCFWLVVLPDYINS